MGGPDKPGHDGVIGIGREARVSVFLTTKHTKDTKGQR
jgi:hypothetical protein